MYCYHFLQEKGAYLYTLFGDKYKLIRVKFIKICVNRLCYIYCSEYSIMFHKSIIICRCNESHHPKMMSKIDYLKNFISSIIFYYCLMYFILVNIFSKCNYQLIKSFIWANNNFILYNIKRFFIILQCN